MMMATAIVERKEERYALIITSIIILVLGLTTVLAWHQTNINNINDVKEKSSQDLVLSVYKDGIKVLEKENDIWLENWVNMTAGIFSANTFTVKDSTGNSRTCKYFADSNIFATTIWSDDDIKIAIGTGSTAANKEDFKLETYNSKQAVSQPVVTLSGSEMRISFSSTFALVSSTTVSECGLMFDDFMNSAGVKITDDLYVARDTFSPVLVPAGEEITITYTIRFNVA